MTDRSKMYPINTSIREISDNSWLIADNLLLSRQQTVSPSLASWSDENFVLSSASAPIPETRPFPTTSELQKVYDAGDASAVWRVGEAFIKLKDLIAPNATREHTTLQYLREKHPLDFNIPDVYYYTDLGKRYLIILGRLHGLTLNDIWYEMDETTKQACVSRIANICKSLTAWTDESISGVDGNQLTEQYLIKPRAEMDFDPSHLLKSCDEMGMDCSSFVFYHCDLGPGNILFDGSIVLLVSSVGKQLGMFQRSGFAPNFVVRVGWIYRRNLEKLFHSMTGGGVFLKS